MIVGYLPIKKETPVKDLRPTIPFVNDLADLRLRLPVRRADDPLMEMAGVRLPTLTIR